MIKIAVHVLDDDEMTLQLIRDKFSENNCFNVVVFPYPNDFVASINNDVDMIISDYKVDGYSIADTIKDISDKFPGIVTIAISAYFDTNILRKLIKCRISDTVEKNGAYWIDDLYEVACSFIPKIEYKIKLLNDRY